MKIKKIIMYCLIVISIFFIVTLGLLTIKNKGEKKSIGIDDYVPLEEISDEQLRKTNIILYFKEKESNKLSTEIKQIDSKELIQNPAKILVENLMEEPQNDNLVKLLPEYLKLLSLNFSNGILKIYFSDEESDFVNLDESQKNLIIESIEKTLKQLKEINKIEIIINENKINN